MHCGTQADKLMWHAAGVTYVHAKHTLHHMVISTAHFALAGSSNSCKQQWQCDALACLLHQHVREV